MPAAKVTVQVTFSTRYPLHRCARLAVAALIVFSAACESAGEGSVYAVEVRGDAEQAGARLASGAALRGGHEISVRRGRVTIEMDGVGQIRVFSNTRLKVSQGRSDARVRLLVGRIWAEVSQLGRERRFEVETSNAVAGVRGTEFVVEANEDVTDVRVVDGAVSVANSRHRQEVTEVKAGQRSAVTGRSSPTKPEPYDPAADEKLWRRLKDLFEEVRHAAHDAANEVGKAAKETAPKLKRDLQEGAKELRGNLKRVFDE